MIKFFKDLLTKRKNYIKLREFILANEFGKVLVRNHTMFIDSDANYFFWNYGAFATESREQINLSYWQAEYLYHMAEKKYKNQNKINL